jgi:probable lipoprotein NlpC
MRNSRYILYMKIIFSFMLMLTACGLFAIAPLDGGFSGAPKASASQEEKDIAFSEARSKVINAAEKYLNTPYRYGGVTSKGLDCSGLINLSFKDAVGVSPPRSASALYSWVEKIPLDEAQPGDLLFFKTDKSGRITHVALFLGNRRFIHSASFGAKTGVIYTSFDEGSWSRTFAGAGRAFPQISQD